MKIVSRTRAPTSRHAGARLGDSGLDGILADRRVHDCRGPDRADELGDDVADALDHGRALVEDHRDGHGRVEVPAGDVPEGEDRGEQAETERERDDEDPGRCRRRGVEVRDRGIADQQEQERADQLGEVLERVHHPSDCEPGLGAPTIPSVASAARNQERLSPGPAEDLDELETVHRMAGVTADGDRAVPLEQDRGGRRLRRLGQRGDHPCGQLATSRHAERDQRQAREQERGLRERRRVGPFAGEGERHRRREMGMGQRADLRARGMDGEMDRQVRGRRECRSARPARDPGGPARPRPGRPAPVRPCAGRWG